MLMLQAVDRLIQKILAEAFPVCSHMTNMERQILSSILLEAPAWVRIGLTVRDERLRERQMNAEGCDAFDDVHLDGLTGAEFLRRGRFRRNA